MRKNIIKKCSAIAAAALITSAFTAVGSNGAKLSYT